MHWESLTQDLRYTFRTLRRDAGFFAVAVMIIALGIGANTAIFSVVNGLLFRPLQIRAAERLVWIANAGGGPGLSSVTSRVSTFLEWQKQNRSFEELAAYFAFFDYGSYTMLGAGEPERLIGVGVSQNLLSFLGVQPALGRNFTVEECKDDAPLSIILTHGLWQRRFGADPNIVGRRLTLNNGPATVIGVLPGELRFLRSLRSRFARRHDRAVPAYTDNRPLWKYTGSHRPDEAGCHDTASTGRDRSYQ